MAITTIDYNTNYIGKTNANLGLSQELESSPSGGVHTTVLSATDKYKIDLHESMITYKAADTPILQILLNMGDQPAGNPVYLWNDAYEGDGWWDISLDTLRQRNNASSGSVSKPIPNSGYEATYDASYEPFAISNSSDIGGLMKILPVTALGTGFKPTDGSTASHAMTVKPTIVVNNCAYGTVVAPAEAGVAWFAFKKENDVTLGQLEKVYEQLRVILTLLGYTKTVIKDTTDTYQIGEFLDGTTCTLPAEMAFPEIHVANGAGTTIADYLVESFYNIFAKIKYVAYGKLDAVNNTGDIFLMFGIDFSTSNASISLGIYNSSSNLDCACIGVPANVGTVSSGLYTMFRQSGAPDYIGRIMRLIHLGEPTTAAIPNPEGDKYKQAGNVFTSIERTFNFTQIFRSKAYGVTGTHQASNFRFADTFIKTRELHFSKYKKEMNRTMLVGKKNESFASVSGNEFMTGQPVRSTGGFLDQALYPIGYAKMPLPRIGFSQNMNGEDYLITWIENLIDSATTFRNEKGAGLLTFIMSSYFAQRLNLYIRQIMANPRITGGQLTYTPNSTFDMSLNVYDYVSTRGKQVKFVVDPALDNTPSIPVPWYMFGRGSLNPRELLISIDSKNVKRMVLRPDQIEGNIQDIGQDAFLEGMKGECGFMMRYPQNNLIVWAPTE